MSKTSWEIAGEALRLLPPHYPFIIFLPPDVLCLGKGTKILRPWRTQTYTSSIDVLRKGGLRGTLPSNTTAASRDDDDLSLYCCFLKLSARMREPSMVPFLWDLRLPPPLPPPKRQPWRLQNSECANNYFDAIYTDIYHTNN